MTLQELFDKLLDDRAVNVACDFRTAENLRARLCRKWSKYKTDMDAVGFLSEELAACSMGMRVVMGADGEKLPDAYTFTLAPRLKTTFEYKILTLPEQQESKDLGDSHASV